MKTKLFKKEKGFTIIEVLIVLAIAGLILLIVFLAVPALQRNSRNTQIRNSAAAMLGGVNDYVSINNGQLPDDCNDVGGGTIEFTGATGQISTAKIQDGYIVDCGGAVIQPGDTGIIHVRFNAKCDLGSGEISTSNVPRAYAAGFIVETSSTGTANQCVES